MILKIFCIKLNILKYIYYVSLQYRNKSKSQLTSPTPAQLPAVALSAGHIVFINKIFFLKI
jgi:hypothetical protein